MEASAALSSRTWPGDGQALPDPRYTGKSNSQVDGARAGRAAQAAQLEEVRAVLPDDAGQDGRLGP